MAADWLTKWMLKIKKRKRKKKAALLSTSCMLKSSSFLMISVQFIGKTRKNRSGFALLVDYVIFIFEACPVALSNEWLDTP